MHPNKNIFEFHGKMQLGGLIKSIFVRYKNFALAGSMLKVKSWALCLVVYVGKETKIA